MTEPAVSYQGQRLSMQQDAYIEWLRAHPGKRAFVYVLDQARYDQIRAALPDVEIKWVTLDGEVVGANG